MSHVRITLGALVCIMCSPLTTLLKAEQMAALHLITFFIEKVEEPVDIDKPSNKIRKILRPESAIKPLTLDSFKRNSVSGIYATYMGWATPSDPNGQIVFPRKHDENRVQVVVTRSLQPVMSEEALIHHFIAGFDEPVSFYDFRFEEDPTTKKAHWTVKKTPTPPSRIIPLYAVVILAPPDQIMIPEGTFLAFKGGNLILPTIYTNQNLTAGNNAMHFLRINRYFSPVEFAWRFAATQYAEMVFS